MVELPEELRNASLSFYLWSRSPRAGHTLALAIGRFVDPSFEWLSVREERSHPSEEESWVRRLLPEGRILASMSAGELHGGSHVSKETLNSMVRPDGTTAERTSLEHYFLLPTSFQSLLDEAGPLGAVRVIVVSNTERLARLYPSDPGEMRPFADVFSRHGLTMISTAVPPPYAGRYAFDIVLRVDVDSVEDWRAGRLVVEKGLSFGEYRTGATFSLQQLPWYLEAGEQIERAAV